MPFHTRYEHPYGITLLDDLHNLFPEILYDPVRFQQNGLVQFVRDRTEELFDLEFHRNRAYYRIYRTPPPQTPPLRSRPISPPPLVRQSRIVPLNVPIVTTMTMDAGNDLQQTMNMLTSTILGGMQTTELQDLLTPVPVAPTIEQLREATILSSVEPPAEVTCAICQDHAPPQGLHEWRILRSCNHRFHRSCVDTWFQQHVHCPVCRHDIRES